MHFVCTIVLRISHELLMARQQMIREMEGTIQLKKYRAMRSRYGEGVDETGEASRIGKYLNDMLKE
mgnify:CR=1 FL=1